MVPKKPPLLKDGKLEYDLKIKANYVLLILL